MPTYIYRNRRTGQTEEAVYATGKAPGRIRRRGKVYIRDIIATHSGKRTGGRGWPMLSDSAGVHPDQIPEAMAEAKRHGIKIEFSPDGRAKFDSARHQARYLKSIGMHNKDGVFS